jgi:hypothetical protein
MSRIHSIAPVAAVALALAVPGTAGAQQDLRSPDARDGLPAPAKIDLVSPDARDGMRTPAPARGDLVSPDARYGVPSPAAVPPSVTIPRMRVVEVPRSGFEWGDAAIGGAATLAFVLAATGFALTARPRRTAASTR